MCHRQLRFSKSTACGHLIFTGETNIDCRDQTCFLSASHPATCGQTQACHCRRYWTQPDRIVTAETPAKCSACS